MWRAQPESRQPLELSGPAKGLFTASFLSGKVDSLWSRDKQLQAIPGQEQPVLSIKKSQFPWIKQEERRESRQMS